MRLLLGVITVLWIALAIGIVAPGLGIVIGIVVTPALVRASVVVKRQLEAGYPVIFEDRMFALLRSSGVALVTALAAAGAFCCVCAPLGLLGFGTNNAWVFYLGFGFGACAGLPVWVFVFRRYWPPKILKP